MSERLELMYLHTGHADMARLHGSHIRSGLTATSSTLCIAAEGLDW